ncbi:MAG: hypothetical protein JNL10_13565 [Verrucomicrobiales bacterium]|nr:hypothetical protein [Verrucomicrobiales bacterium]
MKTLFPIWHGLAVLALILSVPPVSAQQTNRPPEPDPIRGPFWSGTIMLGKDRPAAMKGLAITVGEGKTNYMVYDLDTMRVAAAWSGPFLEFGNTLTKIEWPPPPTVKGTNLVLSTTLGPGWADPQGATADPRDRHQGPLPKSWAHYEGLTVHGDDVVLSYTVGGARVLELPGFRTEAAGGAFTRTLQFLDDARNVAVLLDEGLGQVTGTVAAGKSFASTYPLVSGGTLTVAGAGVPEGATLVAQEGALWLKFPRVPANQPFSLSFAKSEDPKKSVIVSVQPRDLLPLTRGGPAHWTETVTTELKPGTEEGPYVVDTLTEPFPNPYHTRTFIGGFDFLPGGRAVVVMFHGDVWIVSGLDKPSGSLTWRRFASGLFQPLGVKVQNGEIYVAGRDQITRLRDLNGDGEADAYDNFNNDTVVTPNYHEFVLDLHTDSKGNFYYCKGAPWEPNVTSPHQGTMLRVSPDGKKLEVFATGLRAPNGMTVGPDDTVLVSDNQGHWMPSSKLNLVKPGAFMGMVPAAQRDLTLVYTNGTTLQGNPSDPAFRKANNLKGWEGAMPIPKSYDEPICWLPMRWDNSSGGQVIVDSDRWGPWKGAPLFLSYGKCLLYGVLMDSVDGVPQAAMVPFGLKFPSGVMRARFSPQDGQLYVAGLKGWQTAATRDGGFYRVRYTGKPVQMAVKAHAATNGISLTFSTELDPATATDPENYAVELWNYRYSGGYGSPELSVKNPKASIHDKLAVRGVRLSSDHKTVNLLVDGMEPADQFSVRYSVKAAGGDELRSEVIGTIHRLGPALAEAAR